MILITHAFICSMFCLIAYQSTLEGMLLFWLRRILDPFFRNKIGAWIRKPLYGCLTCMCSVWGTTYYLLTFGFTDPVSWIKLVAITGGMNAIIDTYLTIVIVLQKDTHEFSKQEHPAQ